jgi:DNA-directed RNA polymerase specialized sigma24 family protein
MEDDKITDRPTVCPTVPEEMRMNEQDLGPVAEARELMAEDTALQLFQIAALMLGDEQEAVSLVEEVVAKVEADPCAEGTLAYAEARTLLVRTAVQRMAGLYPEAFVVPTSQPADAVYIETDDLGAAGLAAGLSGDQFGALISGAGRAGMREWLERLAPALRTIFVLRAVAGQDGEQTAESLRQSGATGAQAWRRDQVGTAYRQALCSLATCLMSAQTALVPA